MAEADFEIDFYGDAANDPQAHPHASKQGDDDYHEDETDFNDDHEHSSALGNETNVTVRDEHIGAHDEAHEAALVQGTKRKSEEDDRPMDSNATTAIMVSDVNWWTTDDDIRGWLKKAECEGEVKELTFSEHKVNGKSKGQAYVEFQSRQAASAAKHYIDHLVGDNPQQAQKHLSTSYWNPGMNPFRTLPKDAPARIKEQPRAVPSGPFNERGNYGGFRGRAPFGQGRGNMNPGNFNNRGFNNSNGMMGYNNNTMSGGFNGPVPANNFGFNGRGGMMGGMRGGPGGMRGARGNMMGMPPMGGMPMGMPGGMGMMGMGGPMPGFQGMGSNFNTGGFGFNPNQGGNPDWGNPHGAKRPRPE
ncbi:hypothetical protein CDD81_7466 [Ophiocordyceps australis]|uniref:RRM domain-containing protein n=1 Tax=Ophiocordyceps australis TaxID=1399860 RepID=A0A2C5YHN0_9HYPO|nr:hypothetical protein CDD81_7466 [Ophiocordyceps australis]